MRNPGSSDRQVQLINLLLEAYQTEAHGVPLHCQPIQLHQFIQSVLADLQPVLSQLNATIALFVALELPHVEGDRLQLRRVYENLITNALKYNRPGLHLSLSAQVVRSNDLRFMHQRSHSFQHHQEWMYCTVGDNGTGMSQQQCDRAFDLYVRGPNTRQSIGLGLGLYICRQIIEAHGGRIGVISSPGAGATFWFTLPLSRSLLPNNSS